jgi:type IV pilus assembly protein PilA
MFQRFHALRERDERGFTLIELLVVILIIAILAAIAIPVFLNQRKKGWVSASQSSLKNAATAMETYATENNGSYAKTGGWVAADLETYGYNPSTNVSLAITGSATEFCLIATHSLLGTDDWGISSYDSDEGEPQIANDCT